MKKYIFVALAAFAAITFVSCTKNGNDPESGDAKVVVNPKSLTLIIGNSEKIRASVTPAKADAVISFVSSDAEIATVDKDGVVTGIAEGEAKIIAKSEGAKADTCVVTVINFLDAFRIEDYSVFGSAPLSFVEGSDTLINVSFLGGKFNCKIGLWYVLCWDGDLNCSTDGWSGDGMLVDAVVPFYTVDDEAAGEDNGTPFGWGTFAITTVDGDTTANIGFAGKIVEQPYCEFIESYVDALIKEEYDGILWDKYEEGISGALVYEVDYSDPEEPIWYADYGQIYGVVKNLVMVYDRDGGFSDYEAEIQWLDFWSGECFFGVEINEEGTGVTVPYVLRTETREHEGTTAVLSAPRRFNEPTPLKRCKADVMTPRKLHQVRH